ncbi:hypothetical protein GH714_017331 [Hevea brasiliensis]|uniref:Chromo domain-containing protein n=1 Tax=Hevea brasiliensis TaxID=3981 RepID=A0A6A6L3Q4_HEVBR|nr:hypothetical protein GH714_017331 [Hevea brasiliensis]
MGDEPTNLEEKLNSFMQQSEAHFNDLARQLSELVRNLNRGMNQNQDGTSSSQQNLGHQGNDCVKGRTVPRYAKLNFPTFNSEFVEISFGRVYNSVYTSLWKLVQFVNAIKETICILQDSVLANIHLRLQQAQQRMKDIYDKGHRELSFSPSSFAWLRLQPYRQNYPLDSKIQDVFHVHLLRAFKGTPPTTAPVLPPLLDGKVVPTLQTILQSHLNRGIWELLVHWTGLPSTDAT